MSDAIEMTGGQVAAITAEVLLNLAGLGFLGWLLASRKARAGPESVLAPWRIPAVDLACLVCFGIVGALVTNGVAGAVLSRIHLTTDAATVAASVAMEGGLLIGIGLFNGIYGGPREGAWVRPRAGFALWTGAATFIVAMPFVTGVSWFWGHFLTRMGLPDEKQELVSILENTHSAVLRWSFVAVATTIVPIAEELVFRAGLFRYLRTRIPRWAAVALTSVLFAAPHVQWSDHMVGLPSFLPLAVLAAAFCIAYEKTGTLATPIIAHALFNLNMMVLVILGIGK